jgi:hypothetical protein
LYVIEFRTVIFWPFDADGKLAGEDGYVSRDLDRIRKPEASEAPDHLREMLGQAAL